jgi:hypothetical protein
MANQMQVLKLKQLLGPLSLDYIKPEDLAVLLQEAGMGVKTAYRDTIYDRDRYVASTAVPTQTRTFFSVPVGQTQAVANAAATTYTKTLIDTNVTTPNQLARGQIFIVQSIQIMVIFAGATDTTLSGGDTTDPTALAAVSATNHMRAVALSADIRFVLGERPYESGPLWLFPSEYGISGFAGGGAANNFESIAQNGFSRCRRCHPYHTIDAGRRFAIEFTWRNILTPARSFSLVAMLDGIRLTSVQ